MEEYKIFKGVIKNAAGIVESERNELCRVFSPN